MNKETRFLTGHVEFRMDDGEESKPKVRGYAAKYDVESENLGGGQYEIREVIQKGAFDNALNDDIRALLNHDPNYILARSKNGEGSLRVGVDDTGLWYEFEAPDTQAGRDLTESLKRGDIDQSSFSFTIAKDGEQWEERQGENGMKIAKRTITKVARLYDVSPVTYPAYPDATVALRSLEEFQKENNQPAKVEENPVEKHSINHWQRKIELLKKPADKKQK